VGLPIPEQHRDGLAEVDDASTTHGDDQVNALIARDRYRSAGEIHCGLTANREKGKRHSEVLEEPVMALRLRACAHERSRPKPTGGRRDLCRPPRPENDPAGGREFEIGGWQRRPDLFVSPEQVGRSALWLLTWP